MPTVSEYILITAIDPNNTTTKIRLRFQDIGFPLRALACSSDPIPPKSDPISVCTPLHPLHPLSPFSQGRPQETSLRQSNDPPQK